MIRLVEISRVCVYNIVLELLGGPAMAKSFSDLISYFNIKEYINQIMGRSYPHERERVISDFLELVDVSEKIH